MFIIRIFNIKILAILFLITCLFLLLLIQYEENNSPVCSRCRTVSFEYLDVSSTEDVVDDATLALRESMPPLYVKEVDLEEEGETIMSYDQFVIPGLVELSSIGKSVSNIFFVEGSCLVKSPFRGDFLLDCQEACGVEAAARAHPSSPVYVLHSCSLAKDFALHVPEHCQALLSLPNVYVVDLNFSELSEGWPSILPFIPTSLGLLALWQYGGTYLSLDTLVLRPLHPLGTDYCGYRDDKVSIGGGVLNFQASGYGHSLITEILNAYSKDFDSGTAVEDASILTNTVDMECSKLPKTVEECNRFTIYDHNFLFPVGRKDIELLSNNSFASLKQFLSTVKKSAYAISYYKSFDNSYDNPIFDSIQVFKSLMEDLCPAVYKSCNNHHF